MGRAGLVRGAPNLTSRVSPCRYIGSCFCDQPHSDVERKVRPHPAEHNRKPIANADQKEDVHGTPKPPCRRARDLHPSKIRNRTLAADRREAALMPVPERRRRCAAAQPRSQDRGYIGTALLGRRCKAGDRLAIPSERQRGIADRKDIGVSRNRKIRADPGCGRYDPPRLQATPRLATQPPSLARGGYRLWVRSQPWHKTLRPDVSGGGKALPRPAVRWWRRKSLSGRR